MLRQLRIVIIVLVAALSFACGPISPTQPATTSPLRVEATTRLAVEPPPTPAEGMSEQIEIPKWKLWASSGTWLRGANIYQRHVYPELDGADYMGPGPIGPPFTQRDFDTLAAMGANTINISHPGLFSEELPYQLDESSQANLDNLLGMIAAADMFAVISFRTGPGRSEFTFFIDEVGSWFDESYLNDSVWEDEEAKAAWAEMWQYTAERYKDNPIVVGYDLMVEPNANEVFMDTWDPVEFDASYRGTVYDWNTFYPDIVTAIRQADIDTPVLVGAMSYSAVDWLPSLEPIDDPYTVYVIHQYAPVDYTHQYPDDQGHLPNTYPGEIDTDWDGQPESFDRAWLEDLLSVVNEYKAQYGVPVAANEYGVLRYEPGAAEYMNDLMDLFEARAMNYALWAWTPAWNLQHGEEEPFEFRLGPEIDNRALDVPSELRDVILSYWARNTLRPSGVRFVPAGR